MNKGPVVTLAAVLLAATSLAACQKKPAANTMGNGMATAPVDNTTGTAGNASDMNATNATGATNETGGMSSNMAGENTAPAK